MEEAVKQESSDAGTKAGAAGVDAHAMGFPLEPIWLRATVRKVRGEKTYEFVHIFAPISQADWDAYDRRAVTMVEPDKGAGTVSTSLAAEAGWQLWKEAIRDVEGYGELPDNWKEKVPYNHREAAIAALAQVFVADDSEQSEAAARSLDAANTITIEAARNGVEYPRLVHVFREPSESDLKKHRKQRANSLLVGKGKHAKVFLPSQFALLCELYDKLILSVEGYEPNDPAKMDALHKRVAMEALLSGNE